MEIETLWGTVKTRKVATRLSRTYYVLLKDNECLQPLFEWLKNHSIRTTEDSKNEIMKEALNKIASNREVKWRHDPSQCSMLVFQNSAPLEGDFQNGIREYLNLFRYTMYNPEKFLEFKL